MAKLLGLDFICVHTPADNLGARYLVDLIKNKQAVKRVGDLVSIINYS